MKAAQYLKYGLPEVLQIVDVEKPKPKAGEVLIKVHAATMNRTDTGFRTPNYFISRFFTGLFKPTQTVMGSEFAGEVVEIGDGVKDFVVGDKVFGFDDTKGASHAEYMTERSDGPITKIPAGWTYNKIVAAGEGATYALNDIEGAGVKKGQKVMVYGASGGIGSAAVQILKYLGAEVTAVCGTNSLKVVKTLGAHKVVDYQAEDFTDTTDKYDFVFDAVGKTSYGRCKSILNDTGKYCSTELGYGLQNPFLAIYFHLTGSKKVIFPIPKINKDKIEFIKKNNRGQSICASD